jgi:hypothetical protein
MGWGPGTLLTRDILFVYEDGIWLHRFTREESKFLGRDADTATWRDSNALRSIAPEMPRWATYDSPCGSLLTGDLQAKGRSAVGVKVSAVWKIGMGSEIRVPKAAKICLRAAIGCFLPPIEHAREACGYFPNSFSTQTLHPPLS